MKRSNWTDFRPKAVVVSAKNGERIVVGRKCGGGSCIGGNCKAKPDSVTSILK